MPPKLALATAVKKRQLRTPPLQPGAPPLLSEKLIAQLQNAVDAAQRKRLQPHTTDAAAAARTHKA